MRRFSPIKTTLTAVLLCLISVSAYSEQTPTERTSTEEAAAQQPATEHPAAVQPQIAQQSMPPRQMDDMDIAVLRTVDKMSARTHTFNIPVEKTVKFGKSLFIKVRACRKSSPIDKPESAAFLQIWERKPDEEESNWIFSGWMFASNPSTSTMDHPVYDVWVIECKNNATSAKSEEFSTEKAPEAAPVEKTPAADAEVRTDASPAAETPEAGATSTEAVAPAEATTPPTPAQPASPAPNTPPLEQLPSSFENENAAAPEADKPEEGKPEGDAAVPNTGD